MSNIKLFLDMDGCLAEYAMQAEEDFYQEGYFLNLNPHQELLDVLTLLTSASNDIYVVSACVTPISRVEKRKWLDKYLPTIPEERRLFTECGVSKAKEVEAFLGHPLKKTYFLLDDYSPNCLDWEKNGGTAIKFSNGKNCRGINWKGLTLDISKPNTESFRSEK